MRPGLDDKVLADWNGLMIAALVNAGVMLGEPSWIDMAARAFDFIARSDDPGDRLGHSWRDGQLLYPGLASDFAAMIRAALALYEATGRARAISSARWPGSARSTRTTPTRTTAAISSPPTTPRAWWCARPRPPTTPRPIRTRIAAQNLVRLAALTGDDAWREQADRLFDGVLAGGGRQPVQHVALLNALDLRLRAAEIVVTGPDARSASPQAALKLPFLDRIVLRAPSADALPASHPAQAKIAAAAGAARPSSASARPARCR